MKVAIIGAGCSGLPSIKCCIDEGITPVCFERTNTIGGLWKYDPDKKYGSSVYHSTVGNTSKEMMCYSDYPMPENFPNYLHHSKCYEYLQMYAKEFGLYKHIRFNTNVIKCEPTDNFEETGKWHVTARNNDTGLKTTEEFDGILVCIGHHSEPYLPLDHFSGFEKFKGEHLHSHSYKTPDKFQGKRVLVVGIGNSAVDAAVDLTLHAKQVHLSTRRGTWLLTRLSDDGYPIDIVKFTRLFSLIQKLAPNFATNMAEKECNSKFNHELYGLKPEHRMSAQHGTLNDELPNKILNGMIRIKGDIRHFTETGVVFEDGSKEEIDVVIFGTGYRYNFPFLSEDIIKVENNVSSLYKLVWPATLKPSTLAVIGNIQPMGAVNPISELQARCALRVMKGEVSLPSQPDMMSKILARRNRLSAQFVKSPRHTMEVAYVPYMDELAEINGCKPNLFQYLITDPALAIKIFFGPATPYQFRLQGPGSWPKARETILTQILRVEKPLRLKPRSKNSSSRKLFIALFVVSLFLLFFFR